MQKTKGYILIALAALIALLMVSTAARDLIWTVHMQPSSNGEAGYKAGSFIGLILRSMLLGGAALGLLHWGRSTINPAKYSISVLEKDRLRAIYTREQLDQLTFSSVNDELDYASKSDSDLDRIYHAINKEKAPERFQALLAVIKSRVEQNQSISSTETVHEPQN
ncbi:MAG: hypothetical protein JXR40_11460 [Pontiellaceae bacterium]|nr:hypothetical protein [Pontiellaceae bacterium]